MKHFAHVVFMLMSFGSSMLAQPFVICGDKGNYSPISVSGGACAEMGQYVLTPADWEFMRDELKLNCASLMIDGPEPTTTIASKSQLTNAFNNGMDVIFEWSFMPIQGFAGTFPLSFAYDANTLEFHPETSLSFTSINTSQFTPVLTAGAKTHRSGEDVNAIQCTPDQGNPQTICKNIDDSFFWRHRYSFLNFNYWEEVVVRMKVPSAVNEDNALITLKILYLNTNNQWIEYGSFTVFESDLPEYNDWVEVRKLVPSSTLINPQYFTVTTGPYTFDRIKTDIEIIYENQTALYVDQVQVRSQKASTLLSGDVDDDYSTMVNQYYNTQLDNAQKNSITYFKVHDEPPVEDVPAVEYARSYMDTQWGKKSFYFLHENTYDFADWYFRSSLMSQIAIDPYAYTTDLDSEDGTSESAEQLQAAVQERLYNKYKYIADIGNLSGDGTVQLWTTVQSFNDYDGFRYPTPEEMRLQISLSLMFGAKGIIYHALRGCENYSGLLGPCKANQISNQLALQNEALSINDRISSIIGPELISYRYTGSCYSTLGTEQLNSIQLLGTANILSVTTNVPNETKYVDLSRLISDGQNEILAIVNRRTQTKSINYPNGGDREIGVILSMPQYIGSVQYGQSFTNIETGNIDICCSGSKLISDLRAGDIALYKIDDNVVKAESTYENLVTVHDDATWYIDETITLAENSKVVLGNSSSMIFRNGARLILNGGMIEGAPLSQIVLANEDGISGHGKIQSTEVRFPGSALFHSDANIVFGLGTKISCSGQANPAPYVTILGAVEFEPSGGDIEIDDCFEEIRVGAQGALSILGHGSIINVPTVNLWDESIMAIIGQDQLEQVMIKFRQNSELNVYSILNSSWASLMGDNDPDLGANAKWDGVLVVGQDGRIDMKYTTISDIYSDPYYSGTGVHLYEASNQSNIIDNCWITNTAAGQKCGDGVFLQPGSAYSRLYMKCTVLSSDWWTGVSSINSDITMSRCSLLNSKRGFGAYSLNTTLYIRESTIQNCQEEGLYAENTSISFSNGGFIAPGYNRIVNNGLTQIYLKNNSSLHGGIDVPGMGLCGDQNDIGHINQNISRIVIEDGSCVAAMRGNYWLCASPDPAMFTSNGSPCDYSDYEPSSQVPIDVPNCLSFGKMNGPIAGVAGNLSRESIFIYAREGKIHSIAGFIASRIAGMTSVDDKLSMVELFLDALTVYNRQFGDSINVNTRRCDALIHAASSNIPISYTPVVLALRAKTKFILGQMDSCYSISNYLTTQYPTSLSAKKNLITKLLAGCALDDSVRVKYVLNEVDNSLLSIHEKVLARSMTRAYLRLKHSGGMPKKLVQHDSSKVTSDEYCILYPVPANDHVLIDYSAAEEGPGTVLIYDRNGLLMDERQIYNRNGRNSISMDCTKYKSGLYFCKVISNKRNLYGRFVVIH
jgi:hypothetical protein